MTALPQPWPSGDAYQSAVLSPRRTIKDARLHNLQVETRFFLGSQRPHLRSGNYGAVYHFRGPAASFAFKVFSRSDPQRHLRYRLLHEHLARFPATPHLVTPRFEQEGIRIQNAWYPALTMDWVHGQPLDLYIERNLGHLVNGELCREWRHVLAESHARQMAHGDLQHGNILVTAAGRICLVDYDGAFVPAMRACGLQASEAGMPAYQHPRRNRAAFDERTDDFSALVILLTLACLTPDRWQRYHRDDNQLLLSRQDLDRPRASALFRELAECPEPPLRKLAAIVSRAAGGTLANVPDPHQVVADPELQYLFHPQWKPRSVPRAPTLKESAANAVKLRTPASNNRAAVKPEPKPLPRLPVSTRPNSRRLMATLPKPVRLLPAPSQEQSHPYRPLLASPRATLPAHARKPERIAWPVLFFMIGIGLTTLVYQCRDQSSVTLATPSNAPSTQSLPGIFPHHRYAFVANARCVEEKGKAALCDYVRVQADLRVSHVGSVILEGIIGPTSGDRQAASIHVPLEVGFVGVKRVELNLPVPPGNSNLMAQLLAIDLRVHDESGHSLADGPRLWHRPQILTAASSNVGVATEQAP